MDRFVLWMKMNEREREILESFLFFSAVIKRELFCCDEAKPRKRRSLWLEIAVLCRRAIEIIHWSSSPETCCLLACFGVTAGSRRINDDGDAAAAFNRSKQFSRFHIMKDGWMNGIAGGSDANCVRALISNHYIILLFPLRDSDPRREGRRETDSSRGKRLIESPPTKQSVFSLLHRPTSTLTTIWQAHLTERQLVIDRVSLSLISLTRVGRSSRSRRSFCMVIWVRKAEQRTEIAALASVFTAYVSVCVCAGGKWCNWEGKWWFSVRAKWTKRRRRRGMNDLTNVSNNGCGAPAHTLCSPTKMQ